MLEQANVEIIWYAFFTEGGLGKTGLSPTITVAKNTGTVEVSDQAMSELALGFYCYPQTPADEGFRVAVCDANTDAVDQRHIPAIMLIGKAGVEHLDAAVGSRAAEATLTEVQGDGWDAGSDTLEKIREAVDNLPVHRETQEI